MGNDVKLEIVDDAVLHQRLANARGLEHADLQLLELGIVEAVEVEAFVVAIGEHVSGAINRRGGELRAVIGGHIDRITSHLCASKVSRLSARSSIGRQRSSPGRPWPRREACGDLVLHALLLDVGERHVAGIGADDDAIDLLRLVGGLRGGADGNLLARGEIVELFARSRVKGFFAATAGAATRPRTARQMATAVKIRRVMGDTGVTSLV